MRLLTVLLLAALASFGTAKVVETLYGPVEGFEYNLSNGKSADIFLGIPFAKAPVGELRFEKPKKLDKWTEVKQAQAFGPSCQPHHRSLMMGPKEAYAEDCLTTNIMAPSKKSSDPKGYPVFVFIYGGAFELGGSAFYPYQNISENFVSQDLIFVTFNYRLSAFGFFSTGDHHMPGNLGLWDQAAALHFIQETITAFGGDPERVTISGESAGAASVSALTFSPHSNQFFQQAIAMSGSINCPWAKSERVVDVSHELAQSLGCKEPSDEILLCMKAKSVDEILDGIDRIGPTHDHLFPYKFHPRFDNEFFPFSFDKLLKDIPKMPFMTGVTAMEGGLMATMTDMPALVTFGIKPENWKSYSAKQLKQFILNKTLKEEDPESLKEELVKFYVNKEGKKDLDWKEALERFILLGSDLHYVFPMYEEAMDKLSQNIPVYIYLEEHFNELSQAHLPIHGPLHGNEFYFIFGATFLPGFELDDKDRKFKKNLLEGFISFAKTGKPTIGGKSWEPITKARPDRYMAIGVESEMKEHLMKESLDFWRKNMAKTGPLRTEL